MKKRKLTKLERDLLYIKHAKSCGVKVPHRKKKEAEAAINEAYKRRGVKLRPYRCTFCGMWHKTSNIKSMSDIAEVSGD